jgi:hypothetical protein
LRSNRTSLTPYHPYLLSIRWANINVPRHVKSNILRVCRFHGKPRPASPVELAEYDVVLTTYATLSAEYKSRGVLHRVNWYRIVLDEGKPTAPDRYPATLYTPKALILEQRIGFEIELLPSSKLPST